MSKIAWFLFFLNILNTFIFANKNCLSREEKIELDSLLDNYKVEQLKEIIISKYLINIDTSNINFQIQFFEKTKKRLVVLQNTVNQFIKLEPFIQNNIIKNFRNNRDKFEDPFLNPKINKLYKKCIEDDSLINCFYAQYYLQKHHDHLKNILPLKDSLKSLYFNRCSKILNNFDKNLSYKKINNYIQRIDSLLWEKNGVIFSIRQKLKCLSKSIFPYTEIINSMEEYNSYNDSLKLKLSNQLKSKTNRFSIEIAGNKSHEQFLKFQNTSSKDYYSILKYLLANKYRTEHILHQKQYMLKKINEIKNLKKMKNYNQALNKLNEYRKELSTITVYNFFSDSLRNEYNKLEKEIIDKLEK